MADLKISALNSLAGADLVAADVVAVVDDEEPLLPSLLFSSTTATLTATISTAPSLFPSSPRFKVS